AGCLGLSELFDVLSENGYGDLAVRVASATSPPSWGAWMAAGESTLREMWGEESRSHNHYFMGAMTHWLYEYVAGVRILAPGWAEFAVDPCARGDLTYASFHYDGPRGRLGARWEQRVHELVVTVLVPPGSRARIHLPGREPFWTDPGEWTHRVPSTT
ncbi:MAG TPA: alpha-L-rhamnosidase C-terminal domain-containing protein, partial [Microlunatus sp.]|nr:alpha-L-rhamnosidase C-terminal domain-containing protein [Microlunatus sp.]